MPPGELFVYEFEQASQPSKKVLAAWSPTGSGRTADVEIDLGGARLSRAERMPLEAGAISAEAVEQKGGLLRLKLTESPIYLWLD